MPNTRYRRGGHYAADMAEYTRSIASDNCDQYQQLKHNLVRALQEDVTQKQRHCLLLYYGKGLNMREIGEQLGINKATVSRNIKRGERRLERCLRYGARSLLPKAESDG